MADHCNCLEGNLLSSFGAAVMDVEDVVEDNVPEVLLTREVPYQLEVDPQGREVDLHPTGLHKALVAVGPDSRMECYSDARIHLYKNHKLITTYLYLICIMHYA